MPSRHPPASTRRGKGFTKAAMKQQQCNNETINHEKPTRTKTTRTDTTTKLQQQQQQTQQRNYNATTTTTTDTVEFSRPGSPRRYEYACETFHKLSKS